MDDLLGVVKYHYVGNVVKKRPGRPRTTSGERGLLESVPSPSQSPS